MFSLIWDEMVESIGVMRLASYIQIAATEPGSMLMKGCNVRNGITYRKNKARLEIRDTAFETPVASFYTPTSDRFTLGPAFLSRFRVDVPFKFWLEKLWSVRV